MKIYTSYYGNSRKLREAGVVMICVSIIKPRYLAHIPQISAVCPTRYMISGQCSHEEYLRRYDEILSKLDAKFILHQIEVFSEGRDVALCCYERPEKFCHRHILAKWLTEQTGIEVKEFEDTEPKIESKRKKEESKLQMLLF